MSANMVQVPVKMGSNKMTINIANGSTMTCRDFISNVLERCKLDKQLARNYAIFELNNGIENKLHSKQEMLQVYSKTSHFIVRKYMRTEKKVVEKVSSEQHQRMVKKCYKKMNQNIEIQASNRPHLASIEQEYLKQMPKTINKRINKLEKRISTVQEIKSVEKPIEEQTAKLANNINILQFLYCKLKKHNGITLSHSHQSNSSYERLVGNESCGNSSDEDDCSIGNCSTSSLQQML